MGKTVETFRMALEGEISRWSGFARALRKPDREAFDELMDICRSYASESSCATNPIIFEPMVMSILLAQQKRIMCLEKELQMIRPQTTANLPESEEQSEPVQAESRADAQNLPQEAGNHDCFNC
jgi:hypothetical protein